MLKALLSACSEKLAHLQSSFGAVRLANGGMVLSVEVTGSEVAAGAVVPEVMAAVKEQVYK